MRGINYVNRRTRHHQHGVLVKGDGRGGRQIQRAADDICFAGCRRASKISCKYPADIGVAYYVNEVGRAWIDAGNIDRRGITASGSVVSYRHRVSPGQCSSVSTTIQAQSGLPGVPLGIDTPGITIDSVIRYMQNRLSPADTGEGRGYAQLAEFARTWKDRVTVNDSSGINMFGQYFMASRYAATARLNTSCAGSGAYAGNWNCIGPDSLPSQNLGRITNLWVCPIDTNFLLATSAGGLFKSKDAGLNWTCISDNTPVSKGLVSPTSIAVSPIDTQYIYLGSGSYYGHVKALEGLTGWDVDDYGNGLLFTTNGGATWQQEVLPLHLPRTWRDSITGAGVFFAPDGNRLYATMSGELFFKTVGSSWQIISLGFFRMLAQRIRKWDRTVLRTVPFGERP